MPVSAVQVRLCPFERLALSCTRLRGVFACRVSMTCFGDARFHAVMVRGRPGRTEQTPSLGSPSHRARRTHGTSAASWLFALLVLFDLFDLFDLFVIPDRDVESATPRMPNGMLMNDKKTCVIIGAAGGIGTELAGILHQSGWALVLAGRSGEKLAPMAQQYDAPSRQIEASDAAATEALLS